jgi:ribosomal protein S18 acetylase RimI-like enzyme
MDLLAADDWLAGPMGMPCFRLNAAAERLAERLNSALPRGRAFVYAKLPPAEVALLQRLEGAGLRMVDVNVQLALDGANAAAGAVGPMAVAVASSEEGVLARDIAGRCFRYSRFHLDPQVARPTADAIKREWITSYCRGARGAELLVAKAEGAVLGFLAVLVADTADGRTAYIDLIGVDAAAQRRGAADALVRAFINRWTGKAGRLAVGTQLANLPSLALYQKHGFRVVNASYVLHGHFLDGAAAPCAA